MNMRFAGLAMVALIAVIATAVLTTWHLVLARGPDVNNDGIVTISDVSAVIQAYRQLVPSYTPTATATPTVTPTPTATSTPAPMIAGNRALITIGNFAGVLLVDTSDGSVISTVTGPGPSLTTDVVGTSCDGTLGATSEAVTAATHRVKIIDTLSGTILVTADVASPFNLGPLWPTGPDRVLFPCPLKGEGGRFDTGSPQVDRAVLLTDTSPCCTVTVYNLSMGQSIFSDLTTGGIWLNCANDMLMYGIASNEATNLVRLADGALIGSVPGYPNVMPTC